MSHATRLERLFINEVSAVDDPANQSPGWTLMKSRSAADLIAEVDAELAVGKAYGDVLESLASATKHLEGAPDEVLGAVETIVKYIRDQLDAGDGSGEAEETGNEGATSKSMMDRIRSLRKAREDVNADELKAELDARDEALSASFAEQLNGAVETITKSVAEALAPVAPVEPEETKEPEASEVTKSESNEEAEAAADAIIEAIGKTNEAVGAVADRLARLEKRAAGRHSVDGQEDGEVEKGKGDGVSDLSKAFSRALSKPGGSVVLR